MAFFLLFHKFFNLFKNFSEKYDNRKIAFLLSLIIAYLFLFLADFPISGQRAFIFLLFVALGYFLGIATSLTNITFLTSIIILLINPYSLFLVGFQLSFTAICAIIITLKYFSNFHNFNYVKKIFLTSLIISILTLPITIFYFQSGSTISPFSNILAIPLVTLIIMPTGIITIILDILFAINIFPLFDFLLNFLAKIASFFAQYNFDIFSAKNLQPSLWSLLFLLINIVILITLQKNYKIIFFVVILYFFSIFIPNNQADIILFNRNKFFLIKDKNNQFLISKNLKAGFLQEKITRIFGDTKKINLKNFNIEQKDFKLNCLDKICFYEKVQNKKNVKIAFINKKISYIALQDICKKVDLVFYNKRTFANCFITPTISQYNLQQYQKINIFIKKGKIYYE